MGIVDRYWFEARLKAYHKEPRNDTDPAWYALRNTIYAAGCRIELSKSRSFHEANKLAWRFFENALSAHTEILYFRTSIVGVQALTLMVGQPCYSVLSKEELMAIKGILLTKHR